MPITLLNFENERIIFLLLNPYTNTRGNKFCCLLGLWCWSWYKWQNFAARLLKTAIICCWLMEGSQQQPKENLGCSLCQLCPNALKHTTYSYQEGRLLRCVKKKAKNMSSLLFSTLRCAFSEFYFHPYFLKRRICCFDVTSFLPSVLLCERC